MVVAGLPAALDGELVDESIVPERKRRGFINGDGNVERDHGRKERNRRAAEAAEPMKSGNRGLPRLLGRGSREVRIGKKRAEGPQELLRRKSSRGN